MITRIARKELIEMMRDGRFRWMAGIVATLLLIALVTGWKHYSAFEREKAEVAKAERNRWLKQERKGPHSAAHYGVYAFKPQTPLASMDNGIEPFVGVSVWLEAHKQNNMVFRPADDATAAQRFGEMTSATVMQILLPLFIILLCFGAFAFEREQGTLRQLLASGVRMRDLALGKILGISTALAILLVPAVITGVGVITLATSAGGTTFLRFFLGCVAYLLYLAVFVFLSLGVSAMVRSSRVALVALLCFWIINCLVTPRAMADFASYMHPTPSALEWRMALEEDLGDPHGAEELEKLKAELLEKYGVERVEDLPVNWSGISIQAGEEHSAEIFDKHYRYLFGILRNQNKFAQLGGILAPMLSIRALSMALSGTDFEHHRHFVEASEAHRRVIQKILNEDLAANPDRNGERYTAGPEIWAKIPDFRYEFPTAGWALQHYGTAVLLLLFWCFVSFVAALRASQTLKP